MDSNKLAETNLADIEALKHRHLDMEQDLLREKARITENVTREPRKEIQSQKRWKDGTETIAKLLQETEKDLSSVQKKNKTLELSVRYLQNRLIQHGLNSDVELVEEEIFIPGPSKEIMDNLVRENSRLRSITKTLGDPDEVQQLRQLRQSNETVEALRAENSELRERCKIAEQSKERHSDETTNLRKQLNAVALTCQDMARKMEANNERQASSSPNKYSPVLELTAQDQAGLARLKHEIELLKGSNANLLTKNQWWQNYNDQREQYVQKLHLELQAAKAGQLEEETKKKYEAILIASRQKLQSAMSEKNQLESQATRLGEEMKTLQEAFSAQGEELRRATQQLEQYSTQGMPSGHDIDALKAQIQICTEDFECERKDREKAQDRLSQAEQDNQNLRRQINQLQKELQHYAAAAASPARPQFQSMNIQSSTTKPPRYGRDPMTMLNIEPEVHLNARGGRSHPHQETRRAYVEEVDSQSPLSEDGDASAALVSRGKREGTASTIAQRKLIQEIGLLQCPKCRKEYESDQHNELLEHIEICC